MKKRLMIVDQNNMFFRYYIKDPSLSKNGFPIGGIQGSMKGIQKLIRDVRPDRVVVCWDGAEGSKRRKLLNKNYKSGRNPIRLNRSIDNLTPHDKARNLIWQMSRLNEFYECLPFTQLLFDNIEADDLIAYTCKMSFYRGWEKVIVSSDKDFYQLLNDEIVIYRPSQSEVMSKIKLIKEVGIHPNNYVMARAMCYKADQSDNIYGIKGIGLPTIAKNLPFLKEERDYILDDIINYSQEMQKEKKLQFYPKIIEGKKKIQDNYLLMQLERPNISIQTKQIIDKIIKTEKLSVQKMQLLKLMIDDGFGNYRWDDLFLFCNKVLDNREQK